MPAPRQNTSQDSGTYKAGSPCTQAMQGTRMTFSPALFIVMPTETEEPVQANCDPAVHLPRDTHFSYLCIQQI